MKNYIYLHICCINNWKDILNNLLFKIKDSGLYDKIDEIRCCILGNYDNYELLNDPKIKIIDTSDNINIYECFTLDHLYDDSKLEDFNVLYIHTKGLKHNGQNLNVLDWVEYMCYFNIYKYDICINLLNNYDTVGVNMQYADKKFLHYSGNYWWTKSSYIKKQEKCVYDCYNAPEFWINLKKNGNYVSLWKSNISNHYTERYSSINYINKNINAEIFKFD